MPASTSTDPRTSPAIARPLPLWPVFLICDCDTCPKMTARMLPSQPSHVMPRINDTMARGLVFPGCGCPRGAPAGRRGSCRPALVGGVVPAGSHFLVVERHCSNGCVHRVRNPQTPLGRRDGAPDRGVGGAAGPQPGHGPGGDRIDTLRFPDPRSRSALHDRVPGRCAGLAGCGSSLPAANAAGGSGGPGTGRGGAGAGR
jgi:hypothetical protein